MATIDNFFSVFDPANKPPPAGIYGDVNYLINQFSGSPKLGIANNAGPSSPHINGFVKVSALFTRLFNCYQKLSVKAIPDALLGRRHKNGDSSGSAQNRRHAKRVVSTERWGLLFEASSDIVPDGQKKSTIAACCVFTFERK